MFENQKPSSSEHKVINPWLYGTEKKVKYTEVVPTEEDHIQRKIKEQDILQPEVLGKGFTEKIEELTNRYGTLVSYSDDIVQFLHYCMLGLRNFALVYDYEELLLWMEATDKKFIKSKGFYVFQEELLGQMEELHSVTEGIVSKPVLPPPALKIEVLRKSVLEFCVKTTQLRKM